MTKPNMLFGLFSICEGGFCNVWRLTLEEEIVKNSSVES